MKETINTAEVCQWLSHKDYQETTIAWLNAIPMHWSIGRLGEHTDLLNGFPFESDGFSLTEGEPLVRIRDVLRGSTDTFYSGPNASEAPIRNGDLLVGMDGDFNVAFWKGGNALLNQRVCCLRPSETLNKRFLYYWLPLPLQYINEITYSTTVKHLSSPDIRKIHFPLPPLPEQRAIAAFLDRETARIDALIGHKQRLIALLEEKRQAVISHAVTKGLDRNVTVKDSGVEWSNQIPGHWTRMRVKHLLTGIEQGWSPDAENREAGLNEWAVMRAGCVNSGTFDERDHKALPSDLAPIESLEIKPGDLLMSRACGSADLVGSVGLVRQCRRYLMLCDKLFRLAVNSQRVSSEFLELALKSRSTRDQIEQNLGGAEGLARNIGQGVIKEIVVFLPPEVEQHSIVDHIAQMTANIEAVSRRCHDGIACLLEYRNALISAAVTGQIDVREEVQLDE